jgi:hypothetical protein
LYGLVIGILIPFNKFSFADLEILVQSTRHQFIDFLKWELFIANPLVYLDAFKWIIIRTIFSLIPWLIAGYSGAEIHKILLEELCSIKSNPIGKSLRIVWILLCVSFSFFWSYYGVVDPILSSPLTFAN